MHRIRRQGTSPPDISTRVEDRCSARDKLNSLVYVRQCTSVVTHFLPVEARHAIFHATASQMLVCTTFPRGVAARCWNKKLMLPSLGVGYVIKLQLVCQMAC